MINQKNKRIEITLSNEELELLNSICLRFNISKSRAISQALKVFAAKRKHIITLSYKENSEKKSDNTKLSNEKLDVTSDKTEQTWEELMKDLNKNKNS